MIESWIQTHLFEEIPEIMAVLDREYSVVKANRRFTDTFGEWHGRRCYDVLLRKSTRCRGCSVAQCFADGTSRTASANWTDKTGRHGHYVTRIVPIPDGNGSVTTHALVMATDITRCERLEREHQILFERVPCYVAVLDREFRIVRANESLRRTFGRKKGKLCHEVFKGSSVRCADCPALRSFEDGGVHTAGSVGLRKNGGSAFYVLTTAPLARRGEPIEHVIEIMHDVSDLKELQNDLVRERQFVAATIDQSFDGVVATNKRLRITVFNPAAENLLGITADQVVGTKQLELVYPELFLAVLRQGGTSCVLPETTIRAQGEDIPIRFAGVVVRDRDEILGTAGFLQDLRNVKRFEREMLDAERLAAVGQTVAGLAHGVKNILTGLEGGLYLVRWGLEDDRRDKLQRGWEMLDRNFDRITTFVREFLNFAKGQVPEVEATEPNDLVEEVAALFEEAAREKGVTIVTELEEGIPVANLDPEGIHKCLSNLVSNAIDACLLSEKGERRVVVRTRERNGRLEFEVEDNGCGMDYEIKRKVFTSFFTTKGTKGTGLGLLETKKVLQEHGGSVEIESSPGVGSTFRLILPRDRLPEPTAKDEDTTPGGESQ
jgi:PAS domain S-box-containing protein